MDTPSREQLLNRLYHELKRCHRCRLAGTRTHVLTGAGDPRARLMLVAQAPGEREDREGRLFIGPSGKVFDKLLNRAGLAREEFFLTNLLKCTLPKCRKPKQDEIAACLPYLEEEIRIVDPEILVPLGFYATRSVMFLNDIPPPRSRALFGNVFGHLYWRGKRKVYPLPHPAAILYQRTLEQGSLELYGKLSILSRVCPWYPLCPMKRFYETGRLDRSWIELYCRGDWSCCVRFQKEELGLDHPDHMLPDGRLDENLAQLRNG